MWLRHDSRRQPGLLAWRSFSSAVPLMPGGSCDLRGHVVEREGCDAYQWLLLISTHDQRHILQIRETKADSKFPK